MKKLTIVKIGGNVINDQDALKTFLKTFSSIEGNKMLVHGGGKLATELLRRLDVPVQMFEGKRITDELTMRIVTMVYAGYVNKTIVSILQADKCDAIGLTGADASCIRAKKRIVNEIDYGFVGDIESVNAEFICGLLDANKVPVFSAITHDGEGQLLNTNADSIASHLAIALSKKYAVRLVYCFEKNGVLKSIEDESSVLKTITPREYADLKTEKIISDGMIPKMDNALRALESGIEYVQIGNADKLTELVNENNYEGTRLQN